MKTLYLDGQPLELRPVRPRDDEFLFQVFSTTRAREMALVDWSDAAKERFLRQQYQAQRSDYEARDPGSVHSVVLRNLQRIGRIWVARRPGEVRLLDLAILPRWQGQGIEEALVEDLKDDARERRLPLRACALKEVPQERLFFEALGFCCAGEIGIRDVMEWAAQPQRAPST